MLRKLFSSSEARLPIRALLSWLGITFILFISAYRYEEDTINFLFEGRANERIKVVANEIKDVTDALRNLDTTLVTYAPSNRAQFDQVTQPLMAQYPEIQYFGFQKATLGPGAIPAIAEELHPGKAGYLAANKDNQPQLKLDAKAASNWEHTLLRAVAMKRVAATDLFFMPGSGNTLPSIAILMPVFEAAAADRRPDSTSGPVIGYTFVVLQAHEVIASVLPKTELKKIVNIDINVYAADAPDEGTLLFRNGGPPRISAMYQPWLTWLLHVHPNVVTRKLNVANGHWSMTVSAQPGSIIGLHPIAWLVLFGGLFISVLAWRYLQIANAHSRHIQRMVDERTAELQESNKKLSDDIAARIETEKALRHSQSILTSAQKIAHLASWEYDVKTGQLQCSDEWFRIYGLEPQSMQPNIEHANSITHPDDLERAKRAMEDAATDDANYQVEKRIVRPDGSIRHVITQGEKIYDSQGKLIAVVGAVLDITPHKEAEIALRQSHEQLRHLAARQESVREDERKRIAREVHDELGALLTSIKAFLSVSIARSQEAGATPDPLVTDAVDLADSAIGSVRKIISDLRPSVLDHLGIWAALEWQLQQIQKQTNLVCECTIHSNAASIELDSEHSVALFRISQEALTNIVRHADASRIVINVACSDHMLLVKIQDDGKGFHVDDHHDQHAWGILGMHERARHFGGEVDIASSHLQGTTVTLRLPLSQDNDAA
jgi:PAS domain S-box-containing protein